VYRYRVKSFNGLLNQQSRAVNYVWNYCNETQPYLRYRGKKSLAWVPLKGRDLKREGEAYRFAGNTFRVFHSRALPESEIRDGTNFSRDRRGHCSECGCLHDRDVNSALNILARSGHRTPVEGITSLQAA
jgi:putative transposase